MTNEAVTIEIPQYLNATRRTVDSGTAISAGTILILGDANVATATAVGSTGTVFGGIAAADKTISNGDTSTNLSAYMNGVFDLKVSAGAAVTMGAKVTSSGANLIRNAVAAEVDAGKAIGVAEEAGAINEVIRVRIGVGV